MKIAVIDSGIHQGHPHVGAVAGVVHLAGSDPLDRLGHGTAVAAAIREKLPAAEIFAVKIFDRRLSSSIEILLQALEWCRESCIDIVNLSLGTANPAHRDALAEAVRRGPIIVSAAAMLPGSLPGVVGVEADPECSRDRFRYRDGIFLTSPYPRPIPGMPPEHNLHGVSFAVANMTGFVARVLESCGRDELLTVLRRC
ncbi:MAG TPA: S8 family serine peptidase [Bryobacteraceae bacterium]|nr:S8 family serine peptidase [Bryobacteraceae bacterium]